METLNLAVIALTVIASLSFMVIYNFSRWEKTPEGINLMTLPLVFIFLALSSFGRRFDLLSQVWANGISTAAWLLAFLLISQRVFQVIKAQKDAKNKENTK